MNDTTAQVERGACDAAGSLPAPERRLVLHCPDITLKGQNQEFFQRTMDRNVRRTLSALGLRWRVGSARGRVYVDCSDAGAAERDAAMAALARVAGISTLGDAIWLRRGAVLTDAGEFVWEGLERAVLSLAQQSFRVGASFAVRTNRTDKALPVKSMEVDRRLGAVIAAGSQWKTVNLSHPDVTFHIDVYPDGFHIYTPKHKGVGGLPVGTTGRALALLSGGIDSPVACAMLARRGCAVDALHIAAAHVREAEAPGSVVARLACELSRYTLHTRLFIVPYTFFDLALTGPRGGLDLMLFRRFLMRCGERLARRLEAGVLIAGDSLGQVASQTMENLECASRAVSIPVYRPLIGMNKQEIIEHARRIGTYDISIEPYKDCCSLIGQSPHTRTFDEQLAALEREIFPDYPKLLDQTFAEAICLEYECGELRRQAVAG